MKKFLSVILSLSLIFIVGCAEKNSDEIFNDGTSNKGESVIEKPDLEDSTESEDDSSKEDSSNDTSSPEIEDDDSSKEEEPPQKEGNGWTFFY